jgi:hypothetical protein
MQFFPRKQYRIYELLIISVNLKDTCLRQTGDSVYQVIIIIIIIIIIIMPSFCLHDVLMLVSVEARYTVRWWCTGS